MDYCIWKAYQTAFRNNKEISNGFNLLEKKAKNRVIVCLIIMIISLIEMIISFLLLNEKLWYLVGFIFCFISAMVIMKTDNNNRKNHADKYIENIRNKNELLKNILKNDFDIETKDQIIRLLSIYSGIVEKKKESDEHNIKFVIILFSALGAILTTSLNNIGLIGIGFEEWSLFAVAFTIIVATISIIIISYSTFDSYRKGCEWMIDELNEVLLTIE